MVIYTWSNSESEALLKYYQIKVATKSLRTVGNMLPSLKNKINKFDQRVVIYKIPCLNCINVYVGKTGRSFKTRRKEDQRDIRPDIIAQLTNEDLKKKFALVRHVCLNGHRIDWESSAILAIESDYKKDGFQNHFMYTKLILFLTMEIMVFIPSCTSLFLTVSYRCCACFLSQFFFLVFILSIMQPLSACKTLVTSDEEKQILDFRNVGFLQILCRF